MIQLFKFALAISALALSQGARLKIGDLPNIPEGGKLWVVLVAGSEGYSNYRHQADVCHAYQVVKEHGVPDENIIVFMKDDIAENLRNPTPGKIINHPDGKDVYAGVPKDYTGEHVNNKVFLDALTGKDMSVGSKKTLKGGPNDHIFIFYSDHGSPGLIAMCDDILYATDLNAAIKQMHKEEKFSKMVLYIEACYSGSLFDTLLDKDLPVVAVTAANGHESSYACYLDEYRHAYLGDEFSVAWMEYSDKEDLKDRDLEHQFSHVRQRVEKSHVCRFGDESFSDYKLSEFQGMETPEKSFNRRAYSSHLDRVETYEVPRALLEHKIRAANSADERMNAENELKELLAKRRIVTSTMERIVDRVTKDSEVSSYMMESKLPLKNFDCYYPAVEAFNTKCFKMPCNEYAMSKLVTFVNLCESGYSSQNIVEAINAECQGRSMVCGIA